MNREKYINNTSYREGYDDGKKEGLGSSLIITMRFLNKLSNDIEYMKKILSDSTDNEGIGHCKNCKWWKDDDGLYRRGVDAGSICPINRSEVFKGDGYCYMYEPQESEDNE